MKYFTVSIANSDGVTVPAIFERDSRDAALSAHHQTLASAIVNPNCTEIMSMVINSTGSREVFEYWKRSEPDPEV